MDSYDESAMNDSSLNTEIDQTLSTQDNEDSPLEPYLVLLSGKHQGKQFKLFPHKNVFGRDESADIVIADPKISRRHGAFVVYPDCIVIEDCGSTNGTFLDGRRIVTEKLGLLSRIRVGNTYMKIDYKKPGEAKSEQALYLAAHTDVLTQIPNRRTFLLRGQEELSFCRRNNAFLTVVMCDVDHFKRINDAFGHPAGDHVLRKLAEILTNEMRSEDTLARYGGEEFIMLLRQTSERQSIALAERIRIKVDQNCFHYRNLSITATLSIGLCCRRSEHIMSLESLIQAADQALYIAKKNGRNRVEIFNGPDQL